MISFTNKTCVLKYMRENKQLMSAKEIAEGLIKANPELYSERLAQHINQGGNVKFGGTEDGCKGQLASEVGRTLSELNLDGDVVRKGKCPILWKAKGNVPQM